MNDIKNRNTSMTAPPVGLAFLLSQVGWHVALAFTKRLRALDLVPYDVGVLRILGSNPGLSQQSLSAILGVFPSRLVALLDDLEARRLIDRRNHPTDRRSYRLHLTKPGRSALAKIGRLTHQLENDVLAALNEKDKKSLRDLLTQIVKRQQITPGVHPAYGQLNRG